MTTRIQLNKSGHRPTAIDLFAGCGGLTCGLKQAGFRVLGAIELDPLAVKTYRQNHRRVRVWESDIRRLTAKQVLETLRLEVGELDLLAGCPPCQGFSSIRRLNGGRYIRDEQNSLLMEYLRFARVLKPRTLMLENVPGLATYWRFGEFVDGLTSLGYQVRWAVLNAADYGVPQRRRRFILLGSRGEEAPSFATPTPVRPSVRDAIGTLPRPGRSGDMCHDISTRRNARIERLIRSIPKNGGSRSALPKGLRLACHDGTDGFKDVYGRMAWDDVAPTITGGCINPSKGRFLHPSQDRAISLREAALLQTFPHNYHFAMDAGKYAVAQMIGNALPPQFVREHARVLSGLLARR